MAEPVFRKVPVEIRDSLGSTIEGILHLPKVGYHSRLSDFLNDETKSFIAVQSAIIYEGEEIKNYRALIINKSSIVRIIEREEKISD